MTTVVQIPAKLDQPNNPVGMGQFFIGLLIVFGILFMILIMVGTVRSRTKAKQEPIDYPILLKPEDQEGYRPTDRGKPQAPRR